MKPRKTVAKQRRRPHATHPLRAQILLYREALRRMKRKAAEGAPAGFPIDDDMISES